MAKVNKTKYLWSWGNYSYHSECGQYLRYKIPANKICPGCKRIIELAKGEA